MFHLFEAPDQETVTESLDLGLNPADCSVHRQTAFEVIHQVRTPDDASMEAARRPLGLHGAGLPLPRHSGRAWVSVRTRHPRVGAGPVNAESVPGRGGGL